jgi:hypothetical protein
MIEKRHACSQHCLSASIQIDFEVDAGFQRITVDLGLTHARNQAK